MYRKPVLEESADTSDDEPDIDIGKLLKDVELFGNYSITAHTQKLTCVSYSYLVYTILSSNVGIAIACLPNYFRLR
jgi:hypothetical protein